MDPQFTERTERLLSLQASSADTRPLLSSPAHAAELTAGGAMNLVYRVQLENGVNAIWKPLAGVSERMAHTFGHRPEETLLNECLAWQLAERLGPPYVDLVPPAVYRRLTVGGFEDVGVLIQEVPGVRSETVPFARAPDQCMAAALFDALQGQQDRHEANWLWDGPERRLHLIDHSYGFARAEDLCKESRFVAWRHLAGASRLTPEELGTLDSLRASGDLDVVAGLLEPEQGADLIDRADQMRSDDHLLPEGNFGGPQAPLWSGTTMSEARRAGELAQTASPRPARAATTQPPRTSERSRKPWELPARRIGSPGTEQSR